MVDALFENSKCWAKTSYYYKLQLLYYKLTCFVLFHCVLEWKWESVGVDVDLAVRVRIRTEFSELTTEPITDITLSSSRTQIRILTRRRAREPDFTLSKISRNTYLISRLFRQTILKIYWSGGKGSHHTKSSKILLMRHKIVKVHLL
jgi:hypothetical protein